MRDYVWLLLVALASVAQAQYFYPQPSPPFEILPVVEETTTTARPIIVTTQPAPVYVQCAFGQECLTASVCSSRPGQENTNFGAQCQNSFTGQVGVCCNPVPTTTVPPTTQPPTTTVPAPVYVQCTFGQECLTASICSARPGQELTNFGAQCQNSFTGQVGVCCNPVPTTTQAPTTLPPTTTQPAPVYVQCSFAQECLSSSVCSARPGQELTNFGAQCQNSFTGQVGVCCNPVPTTTLPPTTLPPTTQAPTTTQPPTTTTVPAPVYVQCTYDQECITASVCSARPGQANSQFGPQCQNFVTGQVGVCCNPPPPPPPTQPVVAPTTAPSIEYLPPVPVAPTVQPVVIETTTTARPTTTTQPAPVYVQCSFAQECLTASVCSSRPGQELTNFGAQCQNIFTGQVGVCCNPVPTTTQAPTTLPPTTTVPAPVYVQCSFVQECITASVCSSRPGQELTNFGAQCQNTFTGQVGVCCNPVPTTTLPPTTLPPTTTTVAPTTTTQPRPVYISCSVVQECVAASICSARPGQANTNFESQCQNSFTGQVGVCCNPVPVTTTTTAAPPSLEYLPPVSLFPDANENSQVSLLFPTPAPTPAPTTARPVPTTAAPTTVAPIVVTYITCVGVTTCESAAVCASRLGGSVGVPAGECQNSLTGLVGVCCNPAPVPTSTTTARPVVVTTQRPLPVEPVLTPEEEEIAFWDFRESIPGDPETDYPILDKIPVTSFTCAGRIDGYYADVETRCQVFHICTSLPVGDPIKNSFLCPNGTIFNQETFACQWWPDVECESSSNFYNLNENIGKVPESSNTNSKVVSAPAPAPAAPAAAAVQVQIFDPIVPAPAPVAAQPVVVPAPIQISLSGAALDQQTIEVSACGGSSGCSGAVGGAGGVSAHASIGASHDSGVSAHAAVSTHHAAGSQQHEQTVAAY